MHKLLKAFRKGVSPGDDIDPIVWCEKWVNLPHSSRNSKVSFSGSPWLVEPFRAMVDVRNKEVCVCGCTGGGKSTLYEAFIPWVISEHASSILFVSNTDADTQSFVESRLMPVIELCEKTSVLLPSGKNRHKKKKESILFPNGTGLWMTGANYSGLQERSVTYFIGDECHAWKGGMIEQGIKRLHDRVGGKTILCSQASEVNDDFHSHFFQGEIHVYNWKCPNCETLVPWNDFGNIKWEFKYDQDGNMIWTDTLETVHLQCPCCAAKFADNGINRRTLAESSQYILSPNPRAMPRHKSYWFCALNVWWIEWKQTVAEFINANMDKNKGNIESLKSWMQKRMCEFFLPENMLETIPIDTHGYSKSDYTNGELTENEVKRIMSVDCQEDLSLFYYVIRAWNGDGSMLVAENRVNTFEELAEVQKRYFVQDACVFIDCAYETSRVMAECAKRHWIGLNGSDAQSYSYTDKRGNNIQRLFSEPRRRTTENGIGFWIGYAGDPIKDILALHRSGRTIYKWELPNDLSPYYRKQINSEVKKPHFNKKTGREEIGWISLTKANHLYDCEVMNIVGAMIHRLLN